MVISRDSRLILSFVVAVLLINPGSAAPPRPKLKDLIEALAGDRSQFEKHYRALQDAITEKDVPALLKAGEDRRPQVRAGILNVLRKFGRRKSAEPCPVPLEYLLRRMKDEDPTVRGYAVVSCWVFAPTYPDLVYALIKALDDQECLKRRPGDTTTVSECAVSALGGLGPRSRSAYRRLIALSEKGAPLTRASAIRALGQLAGDDPSWQPVLLGCLIHLAQTADPKQLRIAAIGALCPSGPAASPAVLILRRGLRIRVTHVPGYEWQFRLNCAATLLSDAQSA